MYFNFMILLAVLRINKERVGSTIVVYALPADPQISIHFTVRSATF